MPELPEVESVRSSLSPLIGAMIEPLHTSKFPRFKDASSASGVVSGVARRGKWLICGLIYPDRPDLDLVAHLGMTGRFLLAPAPVDLPHLHAAWRVDGGPIGVSWLGFADPRRFGRLTLVPAGNYASLPGLASLGPEATDATAAAASLATARRSNRPVKAVLLDQTVLAGAGNIYCDEALFDARVRPDRPASSLTPVECRRISRALAASLATAINNGGTTFRDYRRPDGTRGDNQKRLRCYGRANEPCLRCSTPLSSLKVAGRTSTLCLVCQR